MRKTVYLDNSASTPTDPAVLNKMMPYLKIHFGNPSAIYDIGRKARKAVDDARQRAAAVLECSPQEIIFTGSGTESDNLAILGVARANKDRGRHVITTKIEHHAVINSVEHLRKEGFDATFIRVDRHGLVESRELKKNIRPDTILISVHYANNEIGVIQDLKMIAKAVREEKARRQRDKKSIPIYFHTDACQAAQYLNMDVRKIGVDLMTINGSKIYGPKGVGILYVKRGVNIEPLVYGGGQENKLRSGTENVPGIVGIAEALDICNRKKAKESNRVAKLRDKLIRGIFSSIPKVVLNGHPQKRLPNNANITFLDIEGEAVLLYLDKYGISASTGSACDSESLDPSHVILALGYPYEFAHGSMRFSLGRYTKETDIDYVIKILGKVVKRLREISPIKTKLNARSMAIPQAFAGAMPHWTNKKQSNNKTNHGPQ